jgi:hypothetical protein
MFRTTAIKIGNLAHWDNLKKFGKSRAAQLSILFPAVGYLVLLSDELLTFVQPFSPVESNDALPFKTKIYLIYFGLFSIALGTVAYNLRCPFTIKEFENETKCADYHMNLASAEDVWVMYLAVFGEARQSPNLACTRFR